MDFNEIKTINTFLEFTEADLPYDRFDSFGLTMERGEVSKIVDKLLDAMLEEKDEERQILLTLLQYKAYDLLTQIGERLSAGN